MKTALKTLLVLLVLALLGCVLYWLCLIRHWPWWVGAALFLGLTGLWTLVLYLRHRKRRRRERDFVQRVLAEDDSAIRNAPAHERQAMKDLQEHWAEAVELLRTSRLHRQGNPLYALPWFLVIGESGAGKTSAIQRSGLSSDLGGARRAATIASTRNCDWWFFEKAIILDTAGRYTISIDEEPDQEEWKRFLGLLAQYRKREPLNGIIVAVPADQLLACDDTKLNEDALDIRRRLDNLTRCLGANAPIYVMVTKMDRVLGMSAFAASLQGRAEQAMGYTNADQDPHWREVLKRALASVERRLRGLRTDLVREDPACGPGVLLFPGEFRKLGPGLASFLRPLFADNPYLETPLFRGLFFSSADPGGQPESEFLKTFNLQPPAAPPDGRGLFLKEFFTAILPRDRHLYRPIREFQEWKRLGRNLRLASWALLWLGALGLLGASFTQNLRAIHAFTADWQTVPASSGDLGVDLLAADRVRLELMEMKRRNRNWWIPRLGLDHSLRLERTVQARFLTLFRTSLLSPLNDAVDHQMAAMDNQLEDAQLADYTGYVVTRMAIIQSFLNHPEEDLEHPPAILEQFRQASTSLLQELHPTLSRQVAQLYAENYLANIYWFGDRPERQQMLAKLRWSLQQLLQRNGGDLRWVTANWIAKAPPVELESFWGAPEQAMDPGPSVPGAFTRDGRRNIQAFLDLTEQVLDTPGFFQARGPAFWDWYRQQFREHWYTFAQRFSEGGDGIQSPLAIQRLATVMTTRENPYFQLLDRLFEEGEALRDPSPSLWTALVQRFHRTQELADQQADPAAVGTWDKLKEQRQKLLQQWTVQLDPSQTKAFNQSMAASKPLADYLAAVKDLTPSLLSRMGSYRQMADCFDGAATQDGDGKGSLYVKAHSALVQLQGLLGTGREEQAVWDLVQGPLDYLMEFSLNETAAVLQDQWSEQVLAAVKGAGEDDLPRLLFGSDGRVWKFLQGPAKPFIAKSDRGYLARTSFDRQQVPFLDPFFDFLRKGPDSLPATRGTQGVPPGLTVSLETAPLAVNPGARAAPTGAVVCLQSAGGGQTCLENLNYTQDATFKYDPESGGDTTLRIQFPNLVLTRSYPGSLGFARFLGEFGSGARVFGAQEFPEAKAQLLALGITWIRVAYRVQGGAPVIRLLKHSPLSVPQTIVAGLEEEGSRWN